jgi:hypothetical protein
MAYEWHQPLLRLKQEKNGGPDSTQCKHGPEGGRAVIAAHVLCIFARTVGFATVCKCVGSAIQHGVDMVPSKKR